MSSFRDHKFRPPKESDPKKRCGSIMEVYFPEINSIFIPELICQLLWLTAQVANCRTTKRVFHSNRVGFYCHRIAKAFHSPEVDPLQALWAGLLHDIGICSTSEQELNKDPAILATTSSMYSSTRSKLGSASTRIRTSKSS